MNCSNLTALGSLGLTGWPLSSMYATFLTARWNGSRSSPTRRSMNDRSKIWTAMLPAQSSSGPSGTRRPASSAERSEYSITWGRPSTVTTTPSFSSGESRSTTLNETSASASRCKPMNDGSAIRTSGLST